MLYFLHSMTLHNVTVKVPATTANLGPAFDCVGMALDLFNSVTLTISDMQSFAISGEGEKFLPKSPDNRIFKAMQAVYAEIDKPMPVLTVSCVNHIPLVRGLGSSSAAALSGLAAANALEGEPVSQERILEMAVEIEGHPDNVAPALLGGCQIVVQNGDKIVTSAVKVADGLKAVLFIPDFQMSTSKARSLLSKDVSRKDAVFNMGRTALLCNALSTGDWCQLKTATEDRLHQQARESMFPAMPKIISAALDAGAHGAFLSGAGPTIIALASEKHDEIESSMSGEAGRAKVNGKTMTLSLSALGAHISHQE